MKLGRIQLGTFSVPSQFLDFIAQPCPFRLLAFLLNVIFVTAPSSKFQGRWIQDPKVSLTFDI